LKRVVIAGSNRVLRGGSWINNGRNVRSANRNRNTPDNRNNNIGFRFAPAQTSVDATLDQMTILPAALYVWWQKANAPRRVSRPCAESPPDGRPNSATLKRRTMEAIEFQAVSHNGALQIPEAYRKQWEGLPVRVILLPAVEKQIDVKPKTLFERLRTVEKISGPVDLSENHDAYVSGEKHA
jgi:hypothetical protein